MCVGVDVGVGIDPRGVVKLVKASFKTGSVIGRTEKHALEMGRQSWWW